MAAEAGHGEARPSEREIRRAVAGAAMGNAVEWYDYAIYSYLVTSIGLNFFPEADPTAQKLLVFAGIALPFVLRPLGSFVLGPLGDKFGRRAVLAFTIITMSGATLCVGLIPSFATIGVAAPVLLVAARLVQGFSTGGEYGGAATFIAEYAPDRRRGLLGSFLELGTLSGYVLGAGIATTMQLTLPPQALNGWGWRIPFLLAGPIGLVGFYLRQKLDDSPSFRRLASKGAGTKAPLREALSYWPQILNLIGIVILLNVADYTLLTYMPTYLTRVLNINEAQSLLVLVGVMLAMIAFITPLGALSDRIGRRPVLLASAIGFLLFSYPAISLIEMRSAFAVSGGLLILAVLLPLMLATIGSTLPAMFPTRNRYGAFSLGYGVSTALFGGTAPLVITALIASTGSNSIPAFYLMAAAAIAIVPICLMPETSRRSISHPTRIPGTNP
ncbi:MFS transporter [Pseudonocardia acaciae]|uniref:MFS transporter n=1 Tax=Pseudonocardia acaciae TaxID=551276 RepID=UPI001FE23C28|nr:MFS transporter [Pseudonocardia acaciae]